MLAINDLHLSYGQSEVLHGLNVSVAPNEIVVVIVFEVKIGQTSGMMNFCIPAIYLDPFAMELRQENRTDFTTGMTAEDYRRLDEVLAHAVTPLCVDLAQRKIPIRDLLSLKAGDLVTGRKSEMSLFDPKLATFEAEDVYKQNDAEGFIKLHALRLRVRTNRERKLSRRPRR